MELKKQYNVIKRVVSGEIEALENNNWNDFIKKLGKHPTSASAYWRKIKGKPNNSIKTLKFNNKIFRTDQEKATLFSSLLGETFSHNNQNFNSDDPFYQSILQQESNIKNLKYNEPIKLITIKELEHQIKKLNNKPSAGIDNISNKIIKKLPLRTKETLVKLFNQSLVQSVIKLLLSK